MAGLKQTFYSISGLLNTSLLKKLSAVNPLLPYHHLVSDEKLPHIHHLYPYKNKKEFGADIDFLLKNFKPITPDTLSDCIHNKKPLPKNSFLLTFDDGLREIYNTIAPMLREKGVPAIFFINNRFIDNRDLFYRYKCSLLMDAIKNGKVTESQQKQVEELFTANGFAPATALHHISKLRYAQKQLADEAAIIMGVPFSDFLKQQQPYLTTPQIKELAGQGFAFGSHSADHPFYDAITHNEQLQQTIEPFEFLATVVGDTKHYFAFPHTDKGVHKKYFDEIFAHPQHAPQLIFGTNNQKTDIDQRILQRFNCERPEITVKQAVNGILLYSIAHQLLGKNKVQRG